MNDDDMTHEESSVHDWEKLTIDMSQYTREKLKQLFIKCIHLGMLFEIIISWTKTPQSHFVYCRNKPLKKLLIEWKFPVMRCSARPSVWSIFLFFAIERSSSSFIIEEMKHNIFILWHFQLSTLRISASLVRSHSSTWADDGLTDLFHYTQKNEGKNTNHAARQQEMTTTEIEELIFFRWIFAEQPEKMRFRK